VKERPEKDPALEERGGKGGEGASAPNYLKGVAAKKESQCLRQKRNVSKLDWAIARRMGKGLFFWVLVGIGNKEKRGGGKPTGFPHDRKKKGRKIVGTRRLKEKKKKRPKNHSA